MGKFSLAFIVAWMMQFSLAGGIWLVWQVGNWVDDGAFHRIARDRYKDWYVDRVRRRWIVFYVSIVITSAIAGLLCSAS